MIASKSSPRDTMRSIAALLDVSFPWIQCCGSNSCKRICAAASAASAAFSAAGKSFNINSQRAFQNTVVPVDVAVEVGVLVGDVVTVVEGVVVGVLVAVDVGVVVGDAEAVDVAVVVIDVVPLVTGVDVGVVVWDVLAVDVKVDVAGGARMEQQGVHLHHVEGRMRNGCKPPKHRQRLRSVSHQSDAPMQQHQFAGQPAQ